MKRVLCLLVAFVLSSSVAFSQNETSNNSTVDTKCFFDSIIKKKSVSIEYRHYLDSKVNDKNEFSGFTGKPQFRLDGKADLFDGVLVGGIFVKTSFSDADTNLKGVVDVVEFSLTSPYVTLESDYLDTALTLSWVPALNGNAESINGKIETTVKAPTFDIGVGSLALSSGFELVGYFVPYNREITTDTTKTSKDAGYSLVGTTPKTQKPNFDLTVTVLEANLPLNSVKGLSFDIKSEYESDYKATADDYKAERQTRTSIAVGYACNPNLVFSNTLVYNMNGFYKDVVSAGKWTDIIGLKYTL